MKPSRLIVVSRRWGGSLPASLVVLMLAMAAVASAAGKPEQAAPTPAAKVELKVFMSCPQFKDQFEAYYGQFKARELAQKNIDVTISLEMPPSDQANPILRARLASGAAPDVFTLHARADIPIYYRAGYLTDLSSQPFASALLGSVKRMVTFDGKVVALPMESLAWGYLYNQKIFSDNGLTPPQTLAEMQAVAGKLKEKSITPFLLSFQDAWVAQLMHALALGGIVSSQHPDFVDRMNRGQGSYQEVQDIFNIIDIIMANGTDRPFDVGYMTGAADFANGKAAMWVQGPWAAEPILKAGPDLKLGVAPLPVSDDPKGAMINLAVSTSLAVSSTSRNAEVALDLVNYVLDPKDSSALFQALKFNRVATFHTYSTYPWTDEAMKFVAQGKAYEDLQLPEAVTGEAAQMLQSYYGHQATQQDIITALDKAWADAVKANQTK